MEDEYSVPPPGKIKLKETRASRAERIYARELRRHAREARRISRANGYAVSPPRPARSESISPPRRRPPPPPPPYTQAQSSFSGDAVGTGPTLEEDGYEIEPEGSGYAWMGNAARTAREAAEREEREERLAWMEFQQMERERDPFGDGGGLFGAAGAWQPMPDVHIPYRHLHHAHHHQLDHLPRLHQHHQHHRHDQDSRRHPRVDLRAQMREYHPPPSVGAAAPEIGRMTDEEYTAFIRDGMYKRQHRAELEEAAARQRAKDEAERKKQVERERLEKEERRRMRRIRAEKGKREEEARKAERERYALRWSGLAIANTKDGDVVAVDLGWRDIPWPVYGNPNPSLEGINKDTVREFLWAVAADMETGAGGGGTGPKGGESGGRGEDEETRVRRVLREAIRAFHPDRFFARVLERVKQEDREKVREGVEKCSRLINDLAAENRAS